MQKIKVAFILNGSRNLTTTASELIALCEKEESLEVQRHFTTRSKEAILLAQQCCDIGIDYIVAVGGDGTVNEVVNGIMIGKGNSSVLVIVPNGTGNDFARGTGFSFNTSKFIDALRENASMPIDVAQLNTANGTHYFLNIADVGFGGKVVQILDRQRSFIGGKVSYALAILRTFLRYRKPILEISTPEFHFKGPVLMLAICNGSIFGNGLTINPFAKINDGKLNITLLGKVTFFDYVKNLKKLKSGKAIDHPEAIYLEAEKISIKVLMGEAVSEMDGEYFPEGACEIKVVPTAIQLLKY